MKKEVTLIFLIAFTIPAFSQNDTDTTSKFLDDLNWNLDVVSFGRNSKFEDALGSVNPDNRIANLNEFDAGVYLRSDLKYSKNKMTLWAKGRFNTDVQLDRKTDYEFYFQELKAKFNVSNNISISGGRYFRSIGTSNLLNPSNPFFFGNGRVNPKIEVRPSDFIEMNFNIKDDWRVSLVGNIGAGEARIFNEPFFKFENSYGLFMEYYGNSTSLGVNFTVREDERYHIGLYGQKTISDAAVIWFDGSMNYNPNRFYPVYGHSTGYLAYDVINEEKNEKWFFTAIGGLTYTFSVGPTLSVEYMFNGRGYNDDEFDIYNEAIKDAERYKFDVTYSLANRNLGRSLNTGMPYIRRNYIFAQLIENDVFGQLNYGVRYFYSFDDQSSQASVLLEWNAFDRIEFFTVLLTNMGERNTSLKNLIDYQIMMGLIWKL